MNKMNNQAVEISRYITSFLTAYAPAHLTNSEHTLRTYETAITLYIGYLESVCNVKAKDFSSQCFERKQIEGWLKWLSEERGCTPDTCNIRLSSLRAFLRYLSSQNVKYIYLSTEAKSIPLRHTVKKKVKGLSRDSVKAILAEPDLATNSGIRDETFLVMLYATAARLDEILSLKIENVRLGTKKPYITISGKGNVIRTLYLLPKAVEHLKRYMEVFHGNSLKPESYVFYSRNNGLSGKLSQAAIRKMLTKYAKQAHAKCPDVPLDLHAHQFRHAKASHWLEDGMNIVQISLLLGHAHLQTTMIYLDITTEQEAAALATLEDESVKGTLPKWNPQKDSLSALCGLRKLKN